MPHALAICIPSLNRSDYLQKAVRSIFDSGVAFSKIELCISNNASDHDYSAITELLARAPADLTVRYVVQTSRLSVDAHMLAVKNLATAPYIYFLGDDDFFLAGQLPSLVDLVEREALDLAIFNGQMVDANDTVIGTHFALPPRRYTRISDAFGDLRDKGMFGAVLVKAQHLDDTYFRHLFGTAHGYGCYWFSLFAAHVRQEPIVVIIPDFPLVALRMAQKSYNLVEVYYRDIPYEMAVYKRHLPPGEPQQLNEQFRKRYLKKTSSVFFLAQISNSGIDVDTIRNFDPDFYRQHRLKIALGKFVVSSGAYNLVRNVYRAVTGRRRPS